MTHYLISFPSGEMDIRPDELRAAARGPPPPRPPGPDRGGGVVCGRGTDESSAPGRVAADGSVTEGTYPQTAPLEGGYAVLDLPSYDDALAWAARFAQACRCAQEVRAFQADPEM